MSTKTELLFDLFRLFQKIEALKKELSQLSSEAREVEKELRTLRALHGYTFIRTPQLDAEGVIAQVGSLHQETDKHPISFVRFESLI
jgi:cell shape-determining protein MreC